MSEVEYRLGYARVFPDIPVTAGEVGQWTLVYVVGSHGIDDGGTIKLARRFASDWETPQFDRPGESAYTTVTTNGQAKLRARFEKKGHDRPWMKCIVVDVFDGSLVPGDTVTFVLGDRSKGSPGMRAQSFQESAHEFCIFVDPTNASVSRPIAAFPTVRVVAGPTTELICVVPTQARVGDPVFVAMRGQDRWGNPTPTPRRGNSEALKLTWSGTGDVSFDGVRLTFHTTGSGRVLAEAGELRCESNPITGFERAPTLQRFWGDLHAQTNATVGTGTEEEYFTFARDVARLDFTSHQGNDFQVTDEDWKRLNDTVRRFHHDGKFVVFPGYEWSGNTSAGGDRNVFYLHEDEPIIRSSHWQVPGVPESELTPAHPVNDLFSKLRKHVGLDRVLMGSHVGGRYADIRTYFDQELGPLVEVVSCWGVFEWMLWDAFEKGYIVGVMANSDGHKGRPGSEGPGAGEFGIANGLTCVLAESLTRKDVWAALKNRRCYATTGPRIDLAMEAGGHPMGSVIPTSVAVPLTASVRGAGALDSLSLFCGRDEIQRVLPVEFATCDRSHRVRVSWRGSRMRSRGRRVRWDGVIGLSVAVVVYAKAFQFDSVLDGITSQSQHQVVFKSHTAGDVDGIDLILDHAAEGTLVFESRAGRCEVDLTKLGNEPHICDLGGLDMQVRIERYPLSLSTHDLSISCELPAPAPGETVPYFVKAVQEDGHTAWSSPIYLRGAPAG